MNKLTSTARKLDILFRVFIVVLAIAAAAALGGLVFAGAGVIFRLPIEDTPKLDQNFTTGALRFFVAWEVMDFGALFPRIALVMAALIALLVAAMLGCNTVRRILKPMTLGQPFHSAVSRNINSLAWLTLITGGLYQLLQAAMLLLSRVLQGVDWRLFGQKVFVQISPEFDRLAGDFTIRATPAFDLGFLVLAAVLFLLAYVFRYGEELQTLSDETL